ncbi:DUF2663 family protein [Paenibacillus oryzisoli]|uniref:DUF2663 family protein n=1 Tax=Paenibacillus oryzisoli TaxID=1850517 RepID=UPI003D2A44A4
MSESDWKLSEDSTRMIQELIARKMKWDKMKERQPILSITGAGLVLVVLYALYRTVIAESGGNALLMLDLLIANRLLCGGLLAGVVFIMYASLRAKKVESAKEDYESLRIETIERLEASWLKEEEKSASRDQLSSFLFQRYAINIGYKS